MRLPTGRFSDTTHNLLYGLLMGGDAIGFEKLVIQSDTESVKLHQIPNGTKYAQVVLEADSTSQKQDLCCRFLECPQAYNENQSTYLEQISSAAGMPMGHLGIYEIKDIENLKNFRIINTEPDKSNVLMVQYFQ